MSPSVVQLPRVAPLAAMIGALLAAPGALAATAAEAPTADPVQIQTVVVYGVAPSSALTFETDPRLPRQPVPASDGGDYLRTIPGFNAVRNGGTNSDPVLRGMFGSRLNLLAGEGATHGACPSRMDNAMSYVAPETFDRLVVVKGPQTVLWGPGASAGTVRFEREAPYFPEPGMEGSGSALVGSFGRRDQALDVSAGASRGFARVSANQSRADDYRDGEGHRVPSAWDKWNADAAVGWTPTDALLVQAGVGRGDGQARYAGRAMDGSRFDRESTHLRIEHRDLPGSLGTVEARLYRNTVDHVMDNYTLRAPNPTGPMPMPMASNVSRTSQGGRIAVDADTGAFQWTVGVDGQDSTHRQRSAAGRGAYLARPWLEDARLRSLGGFAELTWHHDDDARLIAGARLDRATAVDQRPTTRGMMPMPNPTFGQARRETLPAGFMRWEDTAGQVQWFAGLGHVQRMPDYWELFSPIMGPAGAPNAFAGIQPERTTQLDMGLEHRGDRSKTWVSAYAGRIADYVLFDYPTASGMAPTTRARNVEARIHGAEAGIEVEATPALTLEGSLAWAWGQNRTDDRPLPQMPPLEARLSASYARDQWTFGALVRAAARQDRVAIGQGSVTGRDIGPSGSFVVLALNAAYRFNEHAQVTVGVDNLLDSAYSEHLNLAGSADFGFPADATRINEPGRNLWMKADFRF